MASASHLFFCASLAVVLIGLSSGCQSGVPSCCCGRCGGYKAHSSKTHALENTVADGLSLWAHPTATSDKTHQHTFEELTDPNFLFAQCCAERQLPDACANKCSHKAFSQQAMQAMFIGLDSCPISVAPELQFCAAQGRDHTACCRARGVHKTSAGEKCLLLCDQRPDRFTKMDLSFAACGEKFTEMKACFYNGVKDAAKELFYPSKQ